MKLAKNFAKKIRNLNRFYIFLGVLGAILLVNRAFPYFLHGAYGFGYDMGIYKKTFEEILSFGDVFRSQVDIFPSFLAYLFNLLHIPIGWLLYYGHILFSAFVAAPLYLLTKEYFGKEAGLVAVALFGMSYVQFFASEFYLFKVMLGGIFFLYGFYFYAKKSYLFLIFVFLLALTQLPQLLLLMFGVGVAALFNRKKDFRFNLISLLICLGAVLILFLFNSTHILNAFDVVFSSLKGIERLDSHNSGLFMYLSEYLRKGILIFVLGLMGIVFSYKKKGARPFMIATFFVMVIVFWKLFFENRFIVEMDLMIIPFAAYFLVYVWDNLFDKYFFKYEGAVVLLVISLIVSARYFETTNPALSPYEVWALDYVREQEDSEYVLVTNSIYAPWMYGYSGKVALSPGIFESVWDFETWVKYLNGSVEEKAAMLEEIADRYGKYYYFEGMRQASFEIEVESERIKKIFDVYNARVYEVIP